VREVTHSVRGNGVADDETLVGEGVDVDVDDDVDVGEGSFENSS